jgi:hypothetical protein
VTKSKCPRSAYLLILDKSILVEDGIVLRSLRDNAMFSGNIKYPGPEDILRRDVENRCRGAWYASVCVASYGFIGDVDTWVNSRTAVSAVELQLE